MDSGLLWFFASLLSVIGPYNLNQYLKRKLKAIPTCSLTFSRASNRLSVFTLSSHWLTMMLTFAMFLLVVFITLVLVCRLSIENDSNNSK